MRSLEKSLHRPVTKLVIGVALLALTSTNAAAQRNVPAPAGLPPAWERFKELGEQAIRARLIDPDSARIEWPNGYHAAGFQPGFRRRIPGYATCGTVNSRNRMGGYTGAATFVVVIDQDRVLYSEVGSSRGSDLLASACQTAVREGRLPPASSMPGVGGTGPTLAALGLETATASNGIVVISVAPDSAAARAGARQGVLLTHINGIALGGLSADLLQRILGAAGQEWRFTTGDGGSLTLLLSTEASEGGTADRSKS